MIFKESDARTGEEWKRTLGMRKMPWNLRQALAIEESRSKRKRVRRNTQLYCHPAQLEKYFGRDDYTMIASSCQMGFRTFAAEISP
jgi:hypothetical protein